MKEKIDFQLYLKKWQKVANQPSGNYTSNVPFQKKIIDRILNKKNFNYKIIENSIDIIPLELDQPSGHIFNIKGMRILSYLQNLYIQNHLTVFRAIRFPTPQRIYELVYNSGISTVNYEHERLLSIYNNSSYKNKRSELKKDPIFSFQPQERIVHGLPVFLLVNDAIQIHRAFRDDTDDLIAIAVSFIPYELIESERICLYSNHAIVSDYSESKGDKKIIHYKKDPYLRIQPNYSMLRLSGIQLYESYLTGYPKTIDECENYGIIQRFFLIKISKIEINPIEMEINNIKIDSNLMGDYSYFLYGFWGDDNIFSRRPAEYLPYFCSEIVKKW